jgi:magnesium transporter
MTTTVAAQLDTDRPVATAVTFILTGSRLVTNRYLDTKPFQQFIAYAEKHPAACTSPLALLAGVVEACTERIADVLERVGSDLDNPVGQHFRAAWQRHADSRDLRRMIERIGFNGELNSKSRESLVSLGRMLMFVQQSAPDDRRAARPLPLDQPRRHVAVRPRELPGHEGVVPAGGDARPDQHRAEQHHQDLLGRRRDADAADAGREHLRHELHFMPELGWHLGYPWAILLMAVSGLVPYLFFPPPGWL